MHCKASCTVGAKNNIKTTDSWARTNNFRNLLGKIHLSYRDHCIDIDNTLNNFHTQDKYPSRGISLILRSFQKLPPKVE